MTNNIKHLNMEDSLKNYFHFSEQLLTKTTAVWKQNQLFK